LVRPRPPPPHFPSTPLSRSLLVRPARPPLARRIGSFGRVESVREYRELQSQRSRSASSPHGRRPWWLDRCHRRSLLLPKRSAARDRKSTRLNSSHVSISYAV